MPNIDPTITQKSTSAPQGLPEASREPFWNHFGSILEPFWPSRRLLHITSRLPPPTVPHSCSPFASRSCSAPSASHSVSFRPASSARWLVLILDPPGHHFSKVSCRARVPPKLSQTLFEITVQNIFSRPLNARCAILCWLSGRFGARMRPQEIRPLSLSGSRGGRGAKRFEAFREHPDKTQRLNGV